MIIAKIPMLALNETAEGHAEERERGQRVMEGVPARSYRRMGGAAAY